MVYIILPFLHIWHICHVWHITYNSHVYDNIKTFKKPIAFSFFLWVPAFDLRLWSLHLSFDRFDSLTSFLLFSVLLEFCQSNAVSIIRNNRGCTHLLLIILSETKCVIAIVNNYYFIWNWEFEFEFNDSHLKKK